MVQLIFIFIINVFPYYTFSSTEILECLVNKELENNQITPNKLYTSKTIKIFIDKKNEWVSEVSFKEFSDNIELKERVKKNYLGDKKIIKFSFHEYYSSSKKILENMYSIIIEKFSGLIRYKKYYFNGTTTPYFTSEIVGNCK